MPTECAVEQETREGVAIYLWVDRRDRHSTTFTMALYGPHIDDAVIVTDHFKPSFARILGTYYVHQVGDFCPQVT